MNRTSILTLDVFYPIVPDSTWVARLANLGVRTLQLRYKSDDPQACSQEISASLAIAEAHHFTLIINDHWRQALKLGAHCVHLGQEDLMGADIPALKKAGIAVGISTHSDEELSRALKVNPDYIALGPIFETKLKKMSWAPQGIDRITEWKQKIGDIPLVAIGGLTPERATAALNAGATSAAVITDFLTAPDPDARVRDWLAWAAPLRNDK